MLRARAPLVILVIGLLVPALGLGADRRQRDEDQGKLLYERHCVACHGVRAGGDGPATHALVVPVPNLQGKVKPDEETVDLVLMGRGPMPAFETSISERDIKKVLIYMSELTTAAPPEPGAEEEAPADP